MSYPHKSKEVDALDRMLADMGLHATDTAAQSMRQAAIDTLSVVKMQLESLRKHSADNHMKVTCIITSLEELRGVLAGMSIPTRKTCMGCGQPTTGSTGAAGLKWNNLCQPCKDAADAQVVRTLEATVKAFPFNLPACFKPKTKECPVCNGTMTFTPGEEDYGPHTGFNRVKTPAVWGCENCEHMENDDQ